MRVKSLVGLTVGPADNNHWGQVLMQPTGYGVVEIYSQEGRAQEVGAHTLSALGAAIATGITSLHGLERASDECVTGVVKSLIVFVPVGRIIYIVLRGEGKVYLRRGNQIAVLMRQHGGISGEVHEGDTIIVASSGFSRLLSQQDIASFFDHETPSIVAEKLTLALHEKKDGEGSVALVYQVEQFEEYEETSKSSPMTQGNPRFIAVTSYIRRIRNQPNDARRMLAIVLSLMFFVSVVLGIIRQVSVSSNQEIDSAFKNAFHAFEEGTALLDLNSVKGRERLVQAKEFLDPIVLTVNKRSTQGRKIEDLYQQIQDNLTQSLQITQGDPSLFYDMTLMKKEAVASVIVLGESALVIGDSVNGTIYKLDIASKNISIIGGGEAVSQLSALALHSDRIYALTSRGIVEFRIGEKKSTVIINHDEEWGNIASMVSFGGNIYLLDTKYSRIWKYVSVGNADAINAESISASISATVGSREKFSSLREYLNPDTLPDLTQATNMTIDGTVWVGSRTGRIFHFTQGREETFTPRGVEPALGQDIQVYATDETKNLYVLDRQNSRVVVLDKDGTYLAQYRWTELKSVSAFAVSETQKKILFLSEGKIFSLGLK